MNFWPKLKLFPTPLFSRDHGAAEIRNNIKKNGFRQPHYVAFFLLFFCLATSSWGLTADEKQPAKLSSNSAICNHLTKEDICTYSGNANFDQGTTHLEAQQITIHKAEGKIKKIVASGKHSRYSTIMDENHQQINATADLITIDPLKKVMILENNGQLVTKKTVYKGPYIEYKFE